MSPLNRIKLNKLRNKLDKLDNSLINILKKRTNLVKQVLSLKANKNEIVDRKRINIILREIKKKSIKNNIDPKITKRIWINMIYAYIDYERRNFKKIIIYCEVVIFFHKHFMLSCNWIIFFCFKFYFSFLTTSRFFYIIKKELSGFDSGTNLTLMCFFAILL